MSSPSLLTKSFGFWPNELKMVVEFWADAGPALLDTRRPLDFDQVRDDISSQCRSIRLFRARVTPR